MGDQDSGGVNDCYSAGERGAMLATQRWRGVLLQPMLGLLTGCGVTPDLITIVSTVVGLAFCPLWFVHPLGASGLLLLHVILDGIDGPLARYQNVASGKGSFTDTMADQTVVFASTVTLMTAGAVGIVPAAVYLFAYTIVVAFAMIRNALKIPYSWLIRPRIIVYCWIPINAYWWPGSLDYVLVVFDVLLSWKLLTGFYKLRNKLSEMEGAGVAAGDGGE